MNRRARSGARRCSRQSTAAEAMPAASRLASMRFSRCVQGHSARHAEGLPTPRMSMRHVKQAELLKRLPGKVTETPCRQGRLERCTYQTQYSHFLLWHQEHNDASSGTCGVARRAWCRSASATSATRSAQLSLAAWATGSLRTRPITCKTCTSSTSVGHCRTGCLPLPA